MTVIKVVKNQKFKKGYLPVKPTWSSSFFLLFTRTTKNKSRTTKYPAVEQRQEQHKVRHVWSIGVLSFLFREIWMSTPVIGKYFIKKCQNKVYFLFSPKVFCLQHYAWLKSCDQDCSFGTKISGSLIISPVLWVLPSHNTLSVTHSDTASYVIKATI